MWDRAGDACSVQGKNVEAVLFFILSGNDEAALGVTLNSLQLAELVRTKTDRLNALLFRCSVELLADKWQLLLGSAIKASLNGKITLARTAIARMMQLREFPGAASRNQWKRHLSWSHLFRRLTMWLVCAATMLQYMDC